MKKPLEFLIFHEELSRLHKEYGRCSDSNVRDQIYKDIELLEKAIKLIH